MVLIDSEFSSSGRRTFKENSMCGGSGETAVTDLFEMFVTAPQILWNRKAGQIVLDQTYFGYNTFWEFLTRMVYVTVPLGLWMFERPGELWLNHSWFNFRTVY